MIIALDTDHSQPLWLVVTLWLIIIPLLGFIAGAYVGSLMIGRDRRIHKRRRRALARAARARR
jgi:hypothetical protein